MKKIMPYLKNKHKKHPYFFNTILPLLISIIISILLAVFFTTKYYDLKIQNINRNIDNLNGTYNEINGNLNTIIQNQRIFDSNFQWIQENMIDTQYNTNTQTRNIIGEQITITADRNSSGTIIGKSCSASNVPGTVGCSITVTGG